MLITCRSVVTLLLMQLSVGTINESSVSGIQILIYFKEIFAYKQASVKQTLYDRKFQYSALTSIIC